MIGFMKKEYLARSTVFLSAENILKVHEKITQRNVSPFFMKIVARPINHSFFVPENYFKVDDKRFKETSVRPFCHH